MLLVLQATQRGVGIYDPLSRWDLKLEGPEYAYNVVGIILDDANGAVIVSFRGTDSFRDMLRDLEAADPENAGELGDVPFGFFVGIPAIFERLKELFPGRKIICTGHSRGAAQASLFAAFCAIHGFPVHACVLMGSPRPGRADLNFWLDKIPHWYSFRNGDDPVCDEPPWAIHSHSLVELDEPGPELEGAFGRHHTEFYIAGIAKQQMPALIE
jgi:lipase (class 3)